MPKHLSVYPSELSSDERSGILAYGPMAAQLAEPGEGLLARNLNFVEKEIKIEAYC